MFASTPFQLGYWGTRYLISKYVRNRVSKRVQGTIIAGLAGSSLLKKKKSVKMMTPTTVPRKRSREGSVAVLPDMGTYTNNPVSTAHDYGGYVQRDKEKVVVGRKLPDKSRLSKILSSDIVYSIDRWQKLSSIVNDSVTTRTGSFFLSNVLSGATPTRIRTLPVYMFDLTSLRVNHGYSRGGSNARYSRPFYRLQQNESNVTAGWTSIYNWSIQSGNRPDWSGSTWATASIVSDNQWSYERLPYSNVDKDCPYGKAYLDWSHIKLELIGAREIPSEVTVSLVRLHQDVQPPMDEVDNGGLNVSRSNASNEEYSKNNKFWDKFTASMVGNDLVSGGNHIDISQYLTTIWSRNYKFNPTSTTESDSSGHQRRVDLFYNMDMLVDYSRDDVTYEEDDVGAYNTNCVFTHDANWWNRTIDAGNGGCYPKNTEARVFLMITSKGSPVNDTASNDNTLFPSFDIMVRRKVSMISK